jgi:hypothetical protein
MKSTKYSQYTSKWTNLLLDRLLTKEQFDWLINHEGGQYYVDFTQRAIKFERKQDYEWFLLRWS